MRSMTGFGRAQHDANTAAGGYRIEVEARSVNHKGLDLKFRLPSALAPLQAELTRSAKRLIERGRVDIAVDLVGVAEDRAVDSARLRDIVIAARAVAIELGVDEMINAGQLVIAASHLPRAPQGDPPDLTVAVVSAVDDALAALLASRNAEGAALSIIVGARLRRTIEVAAHIAATTQAAPDQLRARLQRRIDATSVPVDPMRVAAEIALLADRVDVAEELDRLRAHQHRFAELMTQATPGRALDFLCQELLREANTIGSKCQDAAVAHAVVELKTEIERIREQVQNVE